MKIIVLLIILLSSFFSQIYSQVRIRLFTEFTPDYAVFTVISGQYVISDGSSMSVSAGEGEPVLIARANDRIFVKTLNKEVFSCDSVEFRGHTNDDVFSLRINEGRSLLRDYRGDLKCFSDMKTLLLINDCDIEEYIAGVVRAEGGSGQYEEYFKTQAVIARTYTYKYYNKHLVDRYNLCDDTHCQTFAGLVRDTIIINAVRQTRGQVIVSSDSTLINSAFHSNCGGETSPSEYAWVTSQPYLVRVVDPYCTSSRNAHWEKTISLGAWTDLMKKNGYSGIFNDPSVFNFSQVKRVPDYLTGSFSVPMSTIRAELDLRSAFFSVSVSPTGDSVIIKGKGYGHGVGLCQEGAMVMASRGMNYADIVNFYYSGVRIMNIENVSKNNEDKLSYANH
jgi:stage II sporulation protein D